MSILLLLLLFPCSHKCYGKCKHPYFSDPFRPDLNYGDFSAPLPVGTIALLRTLDDITQGTSGLMCMSLCRLADSLFIYLFFAMLAAVCVLTQFMVNRPQGKRAGEFINPQHAILNFPKADPDRVIIKCCSDWKYFSPQ